MIVYLICTLILFFLNSKHVVCGGPSFGSKLEAVFGLFKIIWHKWFNKYKVDRGNLKEINFDDNLNIFYLMLLFAISEHAVEAASDLSSWGDSGFVYFFLCTPRRYFMMVKK